MKDLKWIREELSQPSKGPSVISVIVNAGIFMNFFIIFKVDDKLLKASIELDCFVNKNGYLVIRSASQLV